MLSISLYLGVSSRKIGKNARISLYTCCDRGLIRSAISRQSMACTMPIIRIAITCQEFSMTVFASKAELVPMLTMSWLSLLLGMLCTYIGLDKV